MNHVLVCTLGASWQVIPEIHGFLAPESTRLYLHHPQADRLDADRREADLATPTHLWVVTTGGERAGDSIDELESWHAGLPDPPELRVWMATGTDDLHTLEECREIRELTFRVVLHATELARDVGSVVLSLAGGRKTMSADLQEAGALMGARAWLHVVGKDPLPPALREATHDTFHAPLAPGIVEAVTPLVVGRGSRSELLDPAISLDGQPTISGTSFPLDIDGTIIRWGLRPAEPLLIDAIARRQAMGSRLVANHVSRAYRDSVYEGWRSLQRLAPSRLQTLMQTPLGPEHLGLIRALPKAELHRHLGGCLDVAAQRRVAEAIWEVTPAAARRAALERVAHLLEQDARWPLDWPKALQSTRDGSARAEAASALLMHTGAAVLEHGLFGLTEPRVALKSRHRLGFGAYELPGELTGSAVLAHPAAVEPYAEAIVEMALAEGVRYLELRGSPQKYRPQDPERFIRELAEKLGHALRRREGARLDIGFLWILDRREIGAADRWVEAAIRAHEKFPDFVLGLDLAGDEATGPTEDFVEIFKPAHRECMRITIHAGEGESAENIWKAAYLLNADRIGHGLSLVDHPELMRRFRDRGICLEICPTSNREVVGYRDPALPEAADLPVHPVGTYRSEGVPLSLCTDNPGISRTTLAEEYLAAARMGNGGMTLWDAITLMRQGFVHGFAPQPLRRRILTEVDARMFEILDATTLLHPEGQPDSPGLTPG